MSARNHRPITTSPPTSGDRDNTLGYALELAGRVYPLGMGTFLVGRASNVDFRIDDPLVSRQHAALDVKPDRVMLRDLASRNGVSVNGRSIEGSVPLHVGDSVTIGTEVLRLMARSNATNGRRSIVRTSRRTEPPMPLLDAFGDDDEDEGQLRTRESDPLELLSSIVNRALEQGNAEEAEALISGHLSILLNSARLQRHLKPGACTAATDYALKLARTTGKSKWVDYVFELHTSAHRPLGLQVVDAIQSVAPIARVSRRQLVDEHVRMLESLDSREIGAERGLLLQRLARLLG